MVNLIFAFIIIEQIVLGRWIILMEILVQVLKLKGVYAMIYAHI